MIFAKGIESKNYEKYKLERDRESNIYDDTIIEDIDEFEFINIDNIGEFTNIYTGEYPFNRITTLLLDNVNSNLFQLIDWKEKLGVNKLFTDKKVELKNNFGITTKEELSSFVEKIVPLKEKDIKIEKMKVKEKSCIKTEEKTSFVLEVFLSNNETLSFEVNVNNFHAADEAMLTMK